MRRTLFVAVMFVMVLACLVYAQRGGSNREYTVHLEFQSYQIGKYVYDFDEQLFGEMQKINPKIQDATREDADYLIRVAGHREWFWEEGRRTCFDLVLFAEVEAPKLLIVGRYSIYEPKEDTMSGITGRGYSDEEAVIDAVGKLRRRLAREIINTIEEMK